MAENEVKIEGADEIQFYFRNTSYADLISDMPILSFGLAPELDRLAFKNNAGELRKVMVDSSTDENLPGGRVLVTNEDGEADVSDITDTELSALDGIESNIQEQLDTKLETSTDKLDFIPQAVAPSYLEGRTSYSDARKTLSINTNIEGFNIDAGRTVSTQFIADEDISKGQPLYVSDQTPGALHVKIASNKRYNENWIVGVAGNDAITGNPVEFVSRGAIANLDTTMWDLDVPLYLGDGEIVSVRPQFTYADSIFMGAVIHQDATNGALGIAVGVDPYNVGYDGCVVENHNEEIKVVGTDVVIDVSNAEDAGRNLVFQLDSMENELNTTTGTGTGGAARLVLTSPANVDDDPIYQTIYIDLTGSVPTLKTTTGYPAQPFAFISKCKVHHHSVVSVIGPWVNRKVTSAKAHDGRGSIAHILERLGIMAPEYESGLTPTATLDQGESPDVISLATIAGEVFQTHLHSFPALDTLVDGIFVGNRPLNTNGGSKTYDKIFNIADLAGYTSSDTSRSTNARGHITIIGQINNETNQCRLIANPPTTLYAGNDTQSYKDYNGYSIRSVPHDEKIVSFLVAEIQYDISNTETVTFIAPNGATTTDGQYIVNLLGIALNAAGGGAGAGAAFIPNLTQVVGVGADAGGVTIGNAGNAVLAQDLMPKAQVEDGFVPFDNADKTVNLNGQKLENVRQLDVLGTGTLRSTTKSTTGAALWVADGAAGNDSGFQLYENGVAKWTVAYDFSDEGAYVVKTGDGAVKFRIGADGTVKILQGNLDLNGHKAEDVAAGVADTDGVNLGQVNELIDATTSSLLSKAPTDLDTIELGRYYVSTATNRPIGASAGYVYTYTFGTNMNLAKQEFTEFVSGKKWVREKQNTATWGVWQVDVILDSNGNLDLNGNKLLNVANGVADTDGINKGQLDAKFASGLTQTITADGQELVFTNGLLTGYTPAP